MVEMLRVDDRLIHGQIALRWTKYLRVDSIIVANDKAASDKNQITALKFACPADIKLAIVSIEQAATLMNDTRLDDRKVLTITNNLDDAYKLITDCPGKIKVFNVGNYGKNERDGSERKLFSLGLSANEREIALLQDIIATGVESIVQTLPDTDRASLADMIKK